MKAPIRRTVKHTPADLNRIIQLLAEIHDVYDAMKQQSSGFRDQLLQEGKCPGTEPSETVVVAHDHEPSPQATLFAEYRQAFDGLQISLPQTKAYRSAREKIGNVLKELSHDLDDIFGASETATIGHNLDPKYVISRLTAYKAYIVFMWMLVSHFEDRRDYAAQTWLLEGPEYALPDDLAESVRRFVMQPREPEENAETAGPTPKVHQ